jgi:hypothetical protein
MSTSDDELNEWRAEAKRLREIDRAEQRLVVADHRKIADNLKVPKEDRDQARRHADALERLLRLTPRRRC